MKLPNANVFCPGDERPDQGAYRSGQTGGMLTVQRRPYNLRVRSARIDEGHQLAGVLLGDMHRNAARILAEPDLMREPVENLSNGPALATRTEECRKLCPLKGTARGNLAAHSRHKGEYPRSDKDL